MAKFDLTSVLNSSSLEERSNPFAIKHININMLMPNEKNEYVVDDIEELKFSISHFGLEQNLVVTPLDGGFYKILSGHRRYKALKELYDEGDTRFNTIPCIIRNLDEGESDIPVLTPEEIEEYRIIMTNSTVRNKTDAERMMEINKLKAFYKKLTDSGYELHGRIQHLVAEKLNLSAATVGRYEYIDKHLSEKAKQEFNEGNLSFGAAHELAHSSIEEQSQIISETENLSELTPQDIKAKKNKPRKEEILPHETYEINSDLLDHVTTVADEIREELTDGKVLSKKDYARFLDTKNKIEANLNALLRLIQSIENK